MPIKLCTSIALHIRNLIIYENGTTYRSWHIHISWQNIEHHVARTAADSCLSPWRKSRGWTLEKPGS